MTWTPKYSKDDALSRMDMLVYGVDAVRHPLLGIVIAQNGSLPEAQACNYLYSLRQATIKNIAGRDRNNDLTETEYHDWLRKVSEWHANNSIVFPLRVTAADHPPVRK